MRFFASITFLVAAIALTAQDKTISNKPNADRVIAASHKVMLIPFEPKLYMGEIDRQIGAETGLTYKEIRFKFRDGINQQLYKAFKTSKYDVLDLMDDTVKYKKDIEGIYQYLSYAYMKVPNQENYQPPVKEKSEKKIDKGQLIVETNSDNRFMNAKLTNAKVVPLLYGKYKTDVFVFINQLDIKASGSRDPGQVMDANTNRKITIHYTVYTLDAKEINSGIVEEEFDPALNNPKKIIDKHFSRMANVIVQRANKGLTPKG